MSSDYNPKRNMWFGYLFPLTLAWLLTFDFSWLNAIIAGWVWLYVAIAIVCTPIFFSISRNGLPSAVMTAKNKAIATQIPFYMYVIGFLCSSILYGTLYHYHPVTAITGWIMNILFLASFTHLMDNIKDAIKLRE